MAAGRHLKKVDMVS